ncbi:hypothetical protein VTJ49DRAFT_2369 [Mycothermus thermophilus]|uniref:BZIP domain-containing protein n=1 Tax=Humicola insolens TaxID=85995 RepID=A0ABR3VR84_HUMIN
MDEPGTLNLSKPSFTDFWKKSKSAQGGGAARIRFVESKPPGHGSGPSVVGDGSEKGLTRGSNSQEGAAPTTATATAETPLTSSPSPPSQQHQQQQPPTNDGNENGNNPTALDKAQIRRAQVRRAQTQHRQRKANYIRQLETDVARLRDMIDAAERDTHGLAKENEKLRKKVEAVITGGAASSPGSGSGTAGLLSPSSALPTSTPTPKPIPLSLDQSVEFLMKDSPPAPPAPAPADFGDFTVSLGFDEVINAPTFYVCAPPESAGQPSPPPPPPHHHHAQQRQPPTTVSSSTPAAGDINDLPDLTPSQTQAAINFILALEHPCRLHFHPSAHDPSPGGQPGDPPPPPGLPPLAALLPRAGGHTLMATSLALRGAPGKQGRDVFRAVLRSTRGVRWVPGLGVKLGGVPSVDLGYGLEGTESGAGNGSELSLGACGVEEEEEEEECSAEAHGYGNGNGMEGEGEGEGEAVPGFVAMEWEQRRAGLAAAHGGEMMMMMDIDAGPGTNGHGTGPGPESTTEPRIATAAPPPAPTPAQTAAAAATTTTTPTLGADAAQRQEASSESPPSWRTSALTLRALHGLAQTLAGADPEGAEVTPVQAWFELAQRVGYERLLATPGLLDALKRELHRLVKCRFYGASIRRDEFEGVVARVLVLV